MRLFDPLNMTDTTFWPSAAQLPRLATPYAPGPDGAGLSEAAYGLGWHTTSRDSGKPWPEGIGLVHHGGAHGTNIWIDPQNDQINVFMVAQAGWIPEFDSGQILRAF